MHRITRIYMHNCRRVGLLSMLFQVNRFLHRRSNFHGVAEWLKKSRNNFNRISTGKSIVVTPTFNSAANDTNIFSIFVLSFADVSITNKISGMHSHMASASLKSTSLSSSKSHLLPTKIRATFDVVYRRTSSIHRCMLRNEARFVMSYTV